MLGWTVNSQSSSRQIYTTTGNYGIASPSFAFTTTGDYILTKKYATNVVSVSFWAKQQAGATSSTLIEGFNGTSVETLGALSNADVSTAGAKTYNLTALGKNNINQIRLNYTKVLGNLSIDPNSANSSKGNNDWEIKNTKYFQKAPLKMQLELDDFVIKNNWDKTSIENRSKKLIEDFALAYWNYKSI